MFKAIIVSDFHLRNVDKHGKILPSGINSRLQDRLDHIKKSVDYAINKEVNYWICLGDVFDKINPPEALRERFIKSLTPLIKAGIKIIILIGNHDTDNQIYSFMTEANLLASLDNTLIRIISKPKKVKLGGVDCLFIPWTDDTTIRKHLKKHSDCIVFGHFGVKGATVSGTEYVMSEGIEPALFKSHRMAYLGHYHKSQETKKWMYVGSIAKVDFGERNDIKGFVSLRASSTKLVQKFIDVKDREFIHHVVDQEEDPDFEVLSEWHNLKGKVIKLIFKGDEDWYLRFNMGEVRSTLLNKLEVHRLTIDRETEITDRLRVPEIDTSTSWDKSIEIYCKENDHKDRAELGKALIKEATQ